MAFEGSDMKKRSRGDRVFYTIYFLFILVFCVCLFLGLRKLNRWLVAYEASLPAVKCQEIFDELFGDPDWASLYEQAGIADTAYEGADEYVRYMEQKAKGQTLTYTETSAGTSGDKKYYVKLGSERIASFTLTGQTDNFTDIPDWKLGVIELFFDRTGTYRIEMADGHTATVNGVPLDDRSTIRVDTSTANEYLPAGTSGVKTYTQEISGLLVAPTVTIQDQDGTDIEVSYDEATGTFFDGTIGSDDMPDELSERAAATIKGLAKFLNTRGATSSAESRAVLAEYFDSSENAYQECMRLDSSWIVETIDQQCLNMEISEYVRYSDEIFSARVTMDYTVTTTVGTVKTYPMDYTFFFRSTNGKWKVYDMLMGTVQTADTQIRLTFMDGDTELSTGFYDATAAELTTPTVDIPEGKTLSWVRKDTDEGGHQKLTIVFTPDQTTGVVTLSSASELEPMTLYAYLEDTAEN